MESLEQKSDVESPLESMLKFLASGHSQYPAAVHEKAEEALEAFYKGEWDKVEEFLRFILEDGHVGKGTNSIQNQPFPLALKKIAKKYLRGE